MSKHIPTAGDVAMDLIRGISDESFYEHGMKDWFEVVSKNVDEKTKKKVELRFEKFKNKSKSNRKRQEDLYTAANFLTDYYVEYTLGYGKK